MRVPIVRKAWGFYRTMAEDYGDSRAEDGRWPLKVLGPKFNPHLRGLAWDPDFSLCRVFERPTKKQAEIDGRQRWHGYAIRIRITVKVN